MSLFKTEDIWSIKCGQSENFQSSCLFVGNLLRNESENDQILVGSDKGIVRLFCPFSVQSKENQNSDNPFKYNWQSDNDNAKVELNVKCPIYEIKVGNFCNDDNFNVAILSERKLIYLKVESDLSNIRILEEFNLDRVAFNMCTGKFGSSSSASGDISQRDSTCVQCIDCTLLIFTSGHLSMSIVPGSCLLPGPIEWLCDDDSMVLGSSCHRALLSFKFRNMASSSISASALNPKKSQPDWMINLGEIPLKIQICTNITSDNNTNSTNNSSLVMVLTRFSIFLVYNSTGQIIKKRFDLSLVDMFCYNSCASNSPYIFLTNSRNELCVYKSLQLVWKACLIYPNIIRVVTGKFSGVAGHLVGLNSQGRLFIGYLGTEPHLDRVSLPSAGANNRELIESHDSELHQLQREIHQASIGQKATTVVSGSSTMSATGSKNLPVKLIVDYGSARLDNNNEGKSEDSTAYTSSPIYCISLRLTTELSLQNIQLKIEVAAPLEVNTKLQSYPQLDKHRHEQICPLMFSCSSAMVATSLRVYALATYQLDQDSCSTKIVQTQFNLPLSCVLHVHTPVKQATHKVTLDSSGGDIVDLGRVYSEFNAAQGDCVALGLQYYNDGPIITILASTNSNKYRVQSDHYEALWLVIRDLVDRLANRFKQHLSYNESSVNLDGIFLVVDTHYNIRSQLNQLHQLLEQRTKQFRSIQRLTLSKIKSDKALSDLSNLDVLLDNSISQLVHLSDLVGQQQSHLAIVDNALCASCALIGLLIELAPHTKTNSTSTPIYELFNPLVYSSDELGLEEILNHQFVFILRQLTNNASSTTDKHTSNIGELTMPKSADTFKKHLKLLTHKLMTTA